MDKKNTFTDKEIAEKGLRKASMVILNTHHYREKSHQKEFKTVLNWDKEQYLVFKSKIETLQDLILIFEYIYFVDRWISDKTILIEMYKDISEALDHSYLMLQKCEHLFTNSAIIAKCYRLIKVNQAIFLKIKPYVNVLGT